MPIDFEVTKASNSEIKETEQMLKNIKEKCPDKLEKCKYFFADKGYDSTKLIETLTTEDISPVIDIRNMWKGEETRQFKDTNIVYNYKVTLLQLLLYYLNCLFFVTGFEDFSIHLLISLGILLSGL